MIIDSHCHAWDIWPYQPRVPDPHTRASGDNLLYEMDANGVDRALIVSAQITNNPRNNEYVATLVSYRPDRLLQLVDLDSFWSPTYQSPGADDRLKGLAQWMSIKGFTHYLDGKDDGSWLLGEHGSKLFTAAIELGMIASIHCRPHQFGAISTLAMRFPEVPILIHHMGHVTANADMTETMLKLRSQMAATDNIYLKLSGMVYATADWWDYPYPDVIPLIRDAYETFGPQRLCWGSDYPVVTRSMTYRQSIEIIRSHCDFLSKQDLALIMGGNIGRIMGESFPSDESA